MDTPQYTVALQALFKEPGRHHFPRMAAFDRIFGQCWINPIDFLRIAQPSLKRWWHLRSTAHEGTLAIAISGNRSIGICELRLGQHG